MDDTKQNQQQKLFREKLICLTNKYLLKSFPMGLIVNASEKDQNCDDKRPRATLVRILKYSLAIMKVRLYLPWHIPRRTLVVTDSIILAPSSHNPLKNTSKFSV
jgi:hypothetical protein